MNFWQRMCLNTVLAWLQSTVKNPKSAATEVAALKEVRTYINQIVGPENNG